MIQGKAVSLGVGALCCVLLSAAAAAGPGTPVASEKGLYVVTAQSDDEPVAINRMHTWTLHVESSAGEIVEGAEITVDGGMPEHNHGLPTRPRVTAYLGGGDYRIEGLRFHMGGSWRLRFSIAAAAGTDTATIALEL